MKIQNRIMYTSIFVVCCVLVALPNTVGTGCERGKSGQCLIIRATEEVIPEEEGISDIAPLQNLLPSCNLFIH